MRSYRRGRRRGVDAGYRREEGRPATPAVAGKKARREMGSGGAVPQPAGKKVAKFWGRVVRARGGVERVCREWTARVGSVSGRVGFSVHW
jgi:hypothetical protein